MKIIVRQNRAEASFSSPALSWWTGHGNAPRASPDDGELDDEALLEQLGVEPETAAITELKHVRPSAEKRAAEEIATRQRCADFDKFKPLFDRVQDELDQGLRTTRPHGCTPSANFRQRN